MIQYEPKRWGRVVLRVHGSVLPRVAGRVAAVTAIGAALVVVSRERGIDVSIPGTAHAMVGVALGLLLVFRTNASYDRYWEGRRLLGGLVNNCRDLARQGYAYLAPKAQADLARLIRVLYATIRRGLREEREWPELEQLLGDEERRAIAGASAPPLQVTAWITRLLVSEADAGRLSEQRLRSLDSTLGELVELWGGCERILRTPVPFAYAHHIKAFLTLFCLTTPFALLSTMGWYTPLAAAIVSYGLYGIDEIGVEIEDPFGYDPNDLPLDAIGDTIDGNVAELLAVVPATGHDGRVRTKTPEATVGPVARS